MELEATQDALDIERALSGQRLLYNRPLAIRVADLRAKLKEQQAASNNLNERLGNCKQSAKEGWRYAYELEQERKKLDEENADLRAKLDVIVKHASFLLETMQAGERPDAHYWVEGRWNSEPAYHLRGALRALKEQEKA